MAGETNSDLLREIGEEELVERLISRLPGSDDLVVGPGDDCAVIDTGDEDFQLLKTDCLVEGVHFEPGTKPELVGRKAMNRALSDIAAMGGSSCHALVTIASDSDREVSEVEGWYDGIVAAASEFSCTIAGGETTNLGQPGAIISIALTGKVNRERCVQRTGAELGDIIAVTGRLGGSFASGRHLSFVPRLAEAQWLCSHFLPSAMMDLSDGLGSDLPRIMKNSGVGYELRLSEIPCQEGISVEQAIGEGEDYELLLTMAPEQFERAVGEWVTAFPDLDLTPIGRITEVTLDPISRGWEHYRSS